MQEIARLAGVSRTAVSAVLNNKRGTIRLNEGTRQRIETILQKNNYRVNTFGKALALGQSFLIGVIVPEISLSFIAQALQAIEDFASKRNYGVLLMTSRHDSDRKNRVLDFMLERRVDGIIIGDLSEINEKKRRDLIEKNIPVSYLFQYPKNPLPRSGYVCSDADMIGYMGIRHLLDLGHRHIACVGLIREVQKGVHRAISKVSGRKKIENWPWESPCISDNNTFSRWFNSVSRPTAMFFFGDEYACQILHLALRQGIKIPQDLALVGIDNVPLATQAAIPLTTINQPKYEQGWAAAEVLFDLIDGKPGKQVVFPPELIIRQTT